MRLANDRFLKALRREPLDYPPVWIMRQAGRYLPEYRAVRKKAKNFLDFCKNPEWACEVTLQPIDRFGLDAAILFSDILTIADAMQVGLHFVEGEGPCVERPLRTRADILALPKIDIEAELAYVPSAITLIKHALHDRVPLIGFAGSPWTQAVYLIEGKSSKTFSLPKKMLYQEPEVLHLLLDQLAKYTLRYLTLQIQAGVDVIMLFDTWGGILSHQAFQEFSLHSMTWIVQNLKQKFPETPIILFTKGGGLWLESLADSGCDALGLDWSIDISEARKRVGHRVALQGNLDPCVLYAGREAIFKHVHQILKAYGPHPGHIFNLGHGIYPDISPDHVAYLLEAVRENRGLASI